MGQSADLQAAFILGYMAAANRYQPPGPKRKCELELIAEAEVICQRDQNLRLPPAVIGRRQSPVAPARTES